MILIYKCIINTHIYCILYTQMLTLKLTVKQPLDYCLISRNYDGRVDLHIQ